MMKMTRPRTAKGNSIQLETLWTLQIKRMWTDEDESSQTDNNNQNFENKHQNFTQWKKEITPFGSLIKGLWANWWLAHWPRDFAQLIIIPLPHSDRKKPPPRGVSLFTMFPHQEAWVRGLPSKNLHQVLRGGSSYSRFLMRGNSK